MPARSKLAGLLVLVMAAGASYFVPEATAQTAEKVIDPAMHLLVFILARSRCAVSIDALISSGFDRELDPTPGTIEITDNHMI